VYLTAGKTKIRAIGTTSLKLRFANEDFMVMFQVLDKLSIHILLGMEFIWSNNCVPFANDGIFSLTSGRVLVPMQVYRGRWLSFGKI